MVPHQKEWHKLQAYSSLASGTYGHQTHTVSMRASEQFTLGNNFLVYTEIRKGRLSICNKQEYLDQSECVPVKKNPECL